MTDLIRAEYLKLRTTQVWFWLLLTSIAITSLGVIGQIAGTSRQDLTGNVHDVLSSANAAYIACFVLGVLSVTTEFRYQTITPTVLATPSRWKLIRAKLTTYALVGIAYALVCVAVEVAIAAPWLAAKNVPLNLGDNYTALVAVFAVVALMTLVGLGIGALLKNQIVAVSVGLVFILILDSLIRVIPGVKYAYPFLPSGLIDSITTGVNENRVFNHVTLLPVWGGVVGLIIWGLGSALLGAGISMNRDIT
jgi:ABC-2 type transport system permease protein